MSAHIASVIARAISKGFTSASILQHLTRNFPQYASVIAHAKALGYTTDKILKHLADPSNKNPDDDAYLTDSEKTDKRDKQRRKKEAIGLGIAGLAAAGGLGALASRAMAGQALRGQLLPALGTQAQLPGAQPPLQLPATTPAPMGGAPTQPPQPMPTPSPMQMTPGQQITGQAISPTSPMQAAQAAQAIPEVDSTALIQQMKLEDRIRAMQQAGNTPETIGTALEAMMRPEQKKWLQSQTKMPFPEIVKDYLAKTQIEPVEEKIKPQAEEISLENQIPETEVEKPEIEEQKPPKIEKGSEVLTPSGIGTIQGEDSKGFLVNVDGKTKRFSHEEVEGEPEEVKKSVFDFDPETIPEHLRSEALNKVYLPQDRRHITVKYNQGLKPIRYIYWKKDNKPIETSYINKIVKGIQLPISSGLNFWGGWSADESDSRGAANYEELVANSQEEGEKDDPSKDYWFIREESIYTHPYQEKMTEFLRQKEREFNEKHKKPKRKKKAT